MQDKITINADIGLINMKSFGIISHDNIVDSIEEVRKIYEQNAIEKILIDTTDQKTRPGTSEIFEHFSEFPNEFKLALLMNKKQATLNDIASSDKLTEEEGKEMKVFLDRDNALHWLDN